MKGILCGLALALAAGWGYAQDADLEALRLADQTANTKTPAAAEARWFVEAMVGADELRAADRPKATVGRLSLDLQWDKSLGSGWRFQLADRLDVTTQKHPSTHNSVNTLKEVYVSWQPQSNGFLDVGRINVRNGVATGYNPTDYFRDNAIRSLTSVDPASLRTNRMGTALLRGQFLWEGGSIVAMVSPKITDTRHDEVFNPDFGATNNRDRWLLAFGQRFGSDLNPQLLLYGDGPGDVRAGFNLASLFGDATVAFVEWSGGRMPSQRSRALSVDDVEAFRNQLATGLTYTAAYKLSLTLEYDYNGAGLSRDAWNGLRAGPASIYGRYRLWALAAQEPPTKQRVFLLGTWRDLFVDRLDWSAMLRHTVEDRSRTVWTELRYRWDTIDAALQWQSNHGMPGSEFGAAFLHHSLQLSVRYFF